MADSLDDQSQIEPSLTETAQSAPSGVSDLNGQGDPSLLWDRIQSIVEIGGPVVMVLVLMSFLALTIVVMKLMQFSWLRIGHCGSARRALSHWHDGRPGQAIGLLSEQRNPAAQVMLRAMRGQQSGLAEALVREEVLRFGRDLLFQLRRGFRPLEVIGSLAPLLGLLGTVLGMIKAFQQLEQAGSRVDPSILSGGIWEALLTTAVGLCVAIPVVALLNWLERRVDHLAHDMDSLVTRVFTRDLAKLPVLEHGHAELNDDTAQNDVERVVHSV